MFEDWLLCEWSTLFSGWFSKATKKQTAWQVCAQSHIKQTLQVNSPLENWDRFDFDIEDLVIVVSYTCSLLSAVWPPLYSSVSPVSISSLSGEFCKPSGRPLSWMVGIAMAHRGRSRDIVEWDLADKQIHYPLKRNTYIIIIHMYIHNAKSKYTHTHMYIHSIGGRGV